MPNEGLGIAAIGLEHFKAAVAGHVGDLDQVGAALQDAASLATSPRCSPGITECRGWGTDQQTALMPHQY